MAGSLPVIGSIGGHLAQDHDLATMFGFVLGEVVKNPCGSDVVVGKLTRAVKVDRVHLGERPQQHPPDSVEAIDVGLKGEALNTTQSARVVTVAKWQERSHVGRDVPQHVDEEPVGLDHRYVIQERGDRVCAGPEGPIERRCIETRDGSLRPCPCIFQNPQTPAHFLAGSRQRRHGELTRRFWEHELKRIPTGGMPEERERP